MQNVFLLTRTITTKLQPKYVLNNTILNRLAINKNSHLAINKIQSIKINHQNIRTMSTNNITEDSEGFILIVSVMGLFGCIGSMIGFAYTLMNSVLYVNTCFPSVAIIRYDHNIKMSKRILYTIATIGIVTAGTISGFICGVCSVPLSPFLTIYMIYKTTS
jgi:hypothetical protein